MLYFAYGSNLDWTQMWDRCPSARFKAVAALRDHRLAFTQRSKTRRCGVGDAVADQGKTIWGVVYEIDDCDVGQLDATEGYRPGREQNDYCRRERHVFVDGDDNQPLAVAVYFADPQENPPRPNAAYKGLIVEGANHWRLPGRYIKALKTIKVARK